MKMSITYEQAQMIIEGKWKELAESMPGFDDEANWQKADRSQFPLCGGFVLHAYDDRNHDVGRSLNSGFAVYDWCICIYDTDHLMDRGTEEMTFDIINAEPYLVRHATDGTLTCWKIEE